MKNKSQNSIFDYFEELSSNSVSENFDTAKAFLSELDIDVNELRSTGRNEFKKTFFLYNAKVQENKDLHLLNKVKDKLKESFERNMSLAGDILKNAISERKASFQFRNLDKWSDEELRDVLVDTDLAKLLEDLEDIEDSQ